MKVEITVAENHCPILSFNSKKTPAFMVSFYSHKFLYKTYERKYLAKDYGKC